VNILNPMDLSASGLTAQRQRLNVIAENLANPRSPVLLKAGLISARMSSWRLGLWKISAA
jgi:flagellar basal body rod protein FlgC